jgi:membrane protease YdiL (CAAX protease family)
MLFSVKNRLLPTLLTLAALAGAALAAKSLLGLRWNLALSPALPFQVALGFGAILLSDGMVHGALSLLGRKGYLDRYRALVEYFRPQGPLEIAAGGLMAGAGEEPLFRGVILQGLISRAGLGPVPAILLTALLFGAMHRMPDRRLAPFALWAVLQGLVLGAVYVLTGSLLVPMLIHLAHDISGFSVFAIQRRAGRRGRTRGSFPGQRP